MLARQALCLIFEDNLANSLARKLVSTKHVKNIEYRKASLEDNLQELLLLINAVYKDAEDGMWLDDYCRISNKELCDLI